MSQEQVIKDAQETAGQLPGEVKNELRSMDERQRRDARDKVSEARRMLSAWDEFVRSTKEATEATEIQGGLWNFIMTGGLSHEVAKAKKRAETVAEELGEDKALEDTPRTKDGQEGETTDVQQHISKRELLAMDVADTEAKKQLRKVEELVKEGNYYRAHKIFHDKHYRVGLRVIDAKNPEAQQHSQYLDDAFARRLQRIVSKHAETLVRDEQWEEAARCLLWFSRNLEGSVLPSEVVGSQDLKEALHEKLVSLWSNTQRTGLIESFAEQLGELDQLGLIDRDAILVIVKPDIKEYLSSYKDDYGRWLFVRLANKYIEAGLMTQEEIAEIAPWFSEIEE